MISTKQASFGSKLLTGVKRKVQFHSIQRRQCWRQYAAVSNSVKDLTSKTLKQVDLTAGDVPLQRDPLYKVPALSYKERTLYRAFQATGIYTKKSRIIRNSAALFRSVEEQATQDCWFDALHLERTFQAEQDLITLHAWILYTRFMIDQYTDGEYDSKMVATCLLDQMWENLRSRLKNAKVPKMRMSSTATSMARNAFLDMQSYDKAISNPDTAQDELAAAIFRNIFYQEETADTKRILLLADWTLNELYNIKTQPREDVYHGWITWSPALGETIEDRLERQRSRVEGEWREAIAPQGEMYFYHTMTNERQTDIPTTGLYSRRRWALQQHIKTLQEQGKLSETEVAQLLPSAGSYSAATVPQDTNLLSDQNENKT